jgi:hypothetical protein
VVDQVAQRVVVRARRLRGQCAHQELIDLVDLRAVVDLLLTFVDLLLHHPIDQEDPDVRRDHQQA